MSYDVFYLTMVMNVFKIIYYFKQQNKNMKFKTFNQ